MASKKDQELIGKMALGAIIGAAITRSPGGAVAGSILLPILLEALEQSRRRRI